MAHEPQHKPQSPQATNDVELDPDRMGSAVAKLNELAQQTASPPIRQIVNIIHANWSEHDELLKAVARLWGQQAVVRVMAASPKLVADHATNHQKKDEVKNAAGKGAGEREQAEEEEEGFELEAERQRDGAVKVTGRKGDVEGSVTAVEGDPRTGAPSRLKEAELEAAKNLGENTRASAGVGVENEEEGLSVGGSAGIRQRVNDNVIVGGNVAASRNLGSGEVSIKGGPSVQIRTSDRTTLQAYGLVDSKGQITTGLTFTRFRTNIEKLPLGEDSRKQVFQLYVEGSTGGERGNSVEAGIRFSF